MPHNDDMATWRAEKEDQIANARDAETMRARCEAIVRAEYSQGETVALTRILKAIVALKNG